MSLRASDLRVAYFIHGGMGVGYMVRSSLEYTVRVDNLSLLSLTWECISEGGRTQAACDLFRFKYEDTGVRAAIGFVNDNYNEVPFKSNHCHSVNTTTDELSCFCGAPFL